MKKQIRISDSEWFIMRVLWDHPSLSSGEVCDQLSPSLEWSQKTVNTFLARLESKRIIAAEKIGRLKHYSACLTESECQKHESEFFLKKVFRGKASAALLHFVKREDLTDADIEVLRKLIDQPNSKFDEN